MYWHSTAFRRKSILSTSRFRAPTSPRNWREFCRPPTAPANKGERALRHHSPPPGAHHQLRRAVQVELLHDAPAVRLHGVQAQIEPEGDLLVAVAFGQQLVDLPFAVGEQLEAVVNPAHILQPRVSILE